MRAVVVYESMFGNTRDVAEAIAAGLEARGAEVSTVEVGEAPATIDGHTELLVVGAPTHAFGLSRSATRASAADETDAPLVSTGRGVREWLDGLHAPATTMAATFDTKVDKAFVPGSAAVKAHRRLRRLGLRLVAPAESFLVDGMTGPLQPGELDRARAWGEHLPGVVGGVPA